MENKKNALAVNLKQITSTKYYEKVLPNFLDQSTFDEKTFRREVSFAKQTVNKNGYLAKCEASTFLNVILNVAQTGLSLNPTMGYAYIVPRWSRENKRLEACLDPGYKGLLKLILDTGEVTSVEVQLIHANDEVLIDLSDPRKILKHEPGIFKAEGRGGIVGVYSRARLKDGTYHVELMTRRDVEDIRETSESWKAFKDKEVKTAIWNDHFAEMCRKTVLRRHYKYLPKGSGTAGDRLAAAVELDDSANGILKPVSEPQKSLAFSLIDTCTLGISAKDQLYNDVENAEFGYELSEIIDHLQKHQREEEGFRSKDIEARLADRVARDDEGDRYQEAEEVQEEEETIEVEDYNALEEMVQACETQEELDALANEGISDSMKEDGVFQAMLIRKEKEFKKNKKSK